MTDDSSAAALEATDESGDGWPPSNYPILAAVLLLVGAALAPALSTEAAADRLAAFAYYALAVGVGLRVVELVAGERALAALPGRAAGVGLAVSSRVPDGAVGRWLRRLVPAAVVVGGVLLVGWWWLTPGETVPGAFLLGSGLALAAAAVSYLVSSDRRRRRS